MQWCVTSFISDICCALSSKQISIIIGQWKRMKIKPFKWNNRRTTQWEKKITVFVDHIQRLVKSNLYHDLYEITITLCSSDVDRNWSTFQKISGTLQFFIVIILLSRKFKAAVWMSLLSLQRDKFYHNINVMPEKNVIS